MINEYAVRPHQRQPPDAAAFSASGSHPAEHAHRGSAQRFQRNEGHHPGAGRSGMAAEQETFYRSHSGTTKLSHLEENLRASDIRFAAETVKELEDAVAAIPVTGSRYDALQESKIQR